MSFKGTALWPSEYRNGRIAARAATSAALAACALLSAGCIPIVALPTLDSSSRGNVPAAVPSDLLVGTSSRIDVLLALGEPDGRGPDDRWFSMHRRKPGTGGVLIVPPLISGVFAGGESVSRLLMTFDEAGSLSEARLENRKCPQAGLYMSAATARQANSSTSYCLNPAGTDSPEAKSEETAQLAALRPDPALVGATSAYSDTEPDRRKFRTAAPAWEISSWRRTRSYSSKAPIKPVTMQSRSSCSMNSM